MLTAIAFWVVILAIPTGEPPDEWGQTVVFSSTAAYTDLVECSADQGVLPLRGEVLPRRQGRRVYRLVHVSADEWRPKVPPQPSSVQP